jgi:hypothetical protein
LPTPNDEAANGSFPHLRTFAKSAAIGGPEPEIDFPVDWRRSAANLAAPTPKTAKIMHTTEKVVRQFHESWDMRDPDRGAEVIAEDCAFEDIARGEKLPGKEAYKSDYCRW